MELLVRYTVKVSSKIDGHINPLSLLLFTAEGMDYRTVDDDLMFDKCLRCKCVNVTFMEDEMNELDESFTFHLNTSTNISSHFNFGSAEGIIDIIDNDGEKYNDFLILLIRTMVM